MVIDCTDLEEGISFLKVKTEVDSHVQKRVSTNPEPVWHQPEFHR